MNKNHWIRPREDSNEVKMFQKINSNSMMVMWIDERKNGSEEMLAIRTKLHCYRKDIDGSGEVANKLK